MKRVIVTGANGFIGSSLIKRLIRDEIEVIAIDKSFGNNRLPDNNLIYRIETELDDVEKMQSLIPKRDYDALYHFAWQGVNGVEKADATVQLGNISMSINCATVAKNIGVKRILYAGTVAEQAVKSLENLYKTSGGMMYGVAKHCAHLMIESYCKNIGQDFVWMQFSNIYGPNNKTGNLISYTISELKKGNEALFGPAQQVYDFIYVDDLLEAVYRLGESKVTKNFYFIGSGEPRQLKDYLLEIAQIFGRLDLLKIGKRENDGIVYTLDMFDTTQLNNDIGNYISRSFTEGILYTINNY